MGEELWNLLHGHFKNDLSKMLAYLIDAKHAQCGWSALCGKDFNLKPAYTWQKATDDGASYEVYSKRDDYRRPQCFAGRKGEEAHLFTEKDFEDGTDVEWLYAFDQDNRKLYVRDVSAKEDVAVVDLDDEQPNWTQIECGENFERCKHYAWVHGLVSRECRLSTQTYLGRQPFDFRDAVAVIVSGKRYTMTGSGGNASYLRDESTRGLGSDVWVSAVVMKNGHRKNIPTAYQHNGGFKPYDNVVWVMPPTKLIEHETLVSA